MGDNKLNFKPIPSSIKSWYLEDALSDCDQPKKEDVQKTCKLLNLPFIKENAMGIIYGDSQKLPERVLPFWFNELE